MSDLAAWLLEQVAEDERVAREAQDSDALRTLALRYTDRPGYRDEWRIDRRVDE